MGYRGKVVERNKAREMRAAGMTLTEIADALGVSKSSVSLWVRDVPFTPSKRRYGPRLRPNKLQQRKADEIAAMVEQGRARIGALSEREFLVAGAALYAGEGAKGDRGMVVFANSDPDLILFFVSWLRRFFSIEDPRLRLRLYLHQGLDLDAALGFWCSLTGVSFSQVQKPYRAVADASIRHSKHPLGCAAIVYNCARTHREIMGLVKGLLICDAFSGVAQSAEQMTVNH